MNKIGIITILIAMLVLTSCNKEETALEIIGKTIKSIEAIETIYYKQDMSRTNPRQLNDTIFRYREMYFKRLIQDSIVGVKGHWYMYVNDKVNVIYEDIYDGNKLIRKNNRDSVVRVYDLEKYPAIKEKHFWSHNTLYGMQYEFKYVIHNKDSYTIERLNDTIFMNKNCFQIVIKTENKTTMPGFATKLEDSEGLISKTLYLIDKKFYYPLGINKENYSITSPKQKFFINQKYYDIEFNLKIDEDLQFNTSDETFKGFKLTRTLAIRDNLKNPYVNSNLDLTNTS